MTKIERLMVYVVELLACRVRLNLKQRMKSPFSEKIGGSWIKFYRKLGNFKSAETMREKEVGR